MLNTDNIKKLERTLKYGDKKIIARMVGISIPTISRFFGGEEDLIADETQDRIISAIEKLKKDRLAKEQAREQRITKLIK